MPDQLVVLRRIPLIFFPHEPYELGISSILVYCFLAAVDDESNTYHEDVESLMARESAESFYVEAVVKAAPPFSS